MHALRTLVTTMLCGATLAATAAEPATSVDWSRVQPAVAVSVHALAADEAPPQFRGAVDDTFVVEARVVDLLTGTVLSKPRLITRRGERATIRTGEVAHVLFTMTVTIDPASDHADTTVEVRDAGIVTGTSTSRVAFAHG